MRMSRILAVIAVVQLAVASPALAWGDSGHRMVGEAAMRALPGSLPAFLRSPSAIMDVGEYSREPDLWRGSGAVHDADRDPAHFLALDDDGRTLAGLTLDELPATRSLFEAAVRARGIDPAKAGYLPYSTVDAYQQVVKDMAYWRVTTLAIEREKNAAHRAWLKAALQRREDLLLRDIGILSHYVGDATQPMHLSIHSNGWGDYANPQGFTTAPIHWPLEGAYVRTHVAQSDVVTRMAAYAACPDTAEVCVRHRLTRNFAELLPLYRLEKAGGFAESDPRGPAYLAGLLARGASDLRDMIADGWTASADIGVGHDSLISATTAASGSADLYAMLYGET